MNREAHFHQNLTGSEPEKLVPRWNPIIVGSSVEPWRQLWTSFVEESATMAPPSGLLRNLYYCTTGEFIWAFWI